jgi:hypothetical protein
MNSTQNTTHSPTMSAKPQDLEYLTIDSIQWASGPARPRMSTEDKRAKHRIHQRQFQLRQRQRLEQLHREFRCQSLQVLRLQAIQEAETLVRENDALRVQLASDSYCCERDVSSVDDRARSKPFGKQPPIQSTDAEVDASRWLPWCKEQDVEPLSWSAMHSWDIATMSPFV